MINSIQKNFMNDKMSKKIMSLLNEGEDMARFVGGCVRDSFVGRTSSDIDIATKHRPDKIIEILSSNSIRFVPTGIEHGTISVFTDKFNFEITTLRSDTETDGRHAKVRFTDDWELDSDRRDFTINSIYLSSEGKIFDPHKGISDLTEKKIIFIGDSRQRINEDYLRILRFFRFNAYYSGDHGGKENFLSSEALEACEELKFNLIKLSPDRVQNEFFKILLAPRSKVVIDAMLRIGILDVIFSSKTDCLVFYRMVDIDLENILTPNPILRLVSLVFMHNIPPDQMHMFNFSNKQKEKIKFLTNKNHIISLNASEKELRKLLYLHGKENCRDIIRFCWSKDLNILNDIKWKTLLDIIHAWERPVFPLVGSDVMSCDVEEGPILGEILKDLENSWILSDFNKDRVLLLDDLKQLVKDKTNLI